MSKVIPFPPRARPRPVDDGSVLSAAECLADHYDRIERRREDVLGDMIKSVWGAPRPPGDAA